MIEVSVTLAKGLTEVRVTGHANEPGGEIPCAAVSAIIQTAVLGLQSVAQREPDKVRVRVKGK